MTIEEIQKMLEDFADSLGYELPTFQSCAETSEELATEIDEYLFELSLFRDKMEETFRIFEEEFDKC